MLQYCLPVKIWAAETGAVWDTLLCATLECGQENRRTWSVCGVSSQAADIEEALFDLQRQLQPAYALEACFCCRYGQANPYGGDPYLNYICFRQDKGGYASYLGGVDKTDWQFFLNQEQAQPTRLLYHCEDFVFRSKLHGLKADD